jgi:hypothetical protein
MGNLSNDMSITISVACLGEILYSIHNQDTQAYELVNTVNNTNPEKTGN